MVALVRAGRSGDRRDGYGQAAIASAKLSGCWPATAVTDRGNAGQLGRRPRAKWSTRSITSRRGFFHPLITGLALERRHRLLRSSTPKPYWYGSVANVRAHGTTGNIR
jgi:hypothetical protein